MDKTERIKVMITFLRKAGFGDVVDEVKDQQAGIDELKAKYQELIMAVGIKHPNETRHETALRYIQQAEHSDSLSGQTQE